MADSHLHLSSVMLDSDAGSVTSYLTQLHPEDFICVLQKVMCDAFWCLKA